jgi:hypothetical protein
LFAKEDGIELLKPAALLDKAQTLHDNPTVMSRVTVAIVCFGVFLSVSASAQLTPQGSQLAPVGSSQPDRLQIGSTLQRYLGACVHKSLPDLLTVWPDLQNQKKDYERIRRHFVDPSISAEQMTVELLEIHPTKNGALVRAHRTEEFVKIDTLSTPGVGDNRIGEPQFPGPYQSEKKTNVKKSGDVWITILKLDDDWIIASISEKKPR